MTSRLLIALPLTLLLAPALAFATDYRVEPVARQDLKSVFGQVESRTVIPARARIGGTVKSLSVEEGTAVQAGDVLAVVEDPKLALQMQALDAQR